MEISTPFKHIPTQVSPEILTQDLENSLTSLLHGLTLTPPHSKKPLINSSFRSLRSIRSESDLPRLTPTDKNSALLNEKIAVFKSKIKNSNESDYRKTDNLFQLTALKHRCEEQMPKIVSNLEALYGHRSDFDDILGDVLNTCISIGLERPTALRNLDHQRIDKPNWFCSNKTIEATLYVDHHCKTLSKLKEEIPLFKSLNISMLHLMPTIYTSPAQDNDGGYSISNFRTVNPEIGTMDELRDVFTVMRQHEISPVMDFTINHTSHEHPWAEAAKAGDIEKQGFYFLLNENEKNEYQSNLIDIFPEIRKGSFTWNPELNKHVWTTFKSSQWDLNYKNPKVLIAMVEEMLFLANQGAEVFRLDAVPFIWKEKGTPCTHQKNIFNVLGMFNSMAKIATPSVIFKSEAIDEPHLIKPYIGPDLCHMGYNPMLAFSVWDALSQQDATFLSSTLSHHATPSKNSAWVNYTRCHDELAPHYDHRIMQELGINHHQRRTDFTEFYTGKMNGTFSQGELSNANPVSGNIAATQASLAGIEQALHNKDPQQITTAINRIKLLNSVIMSVPGVPLINFTGNDDYGQTNDYSYKLDANKENDNRWLNRPMRITDFSTKDALEIQVMNRVFTDLVDLTRTRANDMPAFEMGTLNIIQTGQAPVLGFTRENQQQKVMVLANFSEKPQQIDAKLLEQHAMTGATDQLNQTQHSFDAASNKCIELAPLQSMWLTKNHMD